MIIYNCIIPNFAVGIRLSLILFKFLIDSQQATLFFN